MNRGSSWSVALACAAVACVSAGETLGAELSYSERLDVGAGGSRKADYMDITASDGGNTLFTMSFNEGASDGHHYWRPGELISFQDHAWGGSPFDYSPESVTTASGGMYRGELLDGAFTITSQTASQFQFTVTDTTPGGATRSSVTTIHAPTNITYSGGKASYHLSIDTVTTISNQSGDSIDIGDFEAVPMLSLNSGGNDDWSILNPIVAGQPYPNVHADDSTDGHQLYLITDWYGTEAGDHNDGFLVRFEVKDNAETESLNMRPGTIFELTNSDISLNYANRTNNNIGDTSVSSYGLTGDLFNARESYGSTIADGDTITATTHLEISFVPEPASIGLLGAGLLLVAARRRI